VTSSVVPAATGPATYVDHGPRAADNVALTFHLGGDPTLVVELLDLLKASGVTSTVFAIGDWLMANPALGHRVVDDGHELGNHTKSHQSMLKLSRADVRAEIVGGGQREDDLDALASRIEQHGLPLESYKWYLDLRRYGSCPHAGFGLGIERTVAWICGLDHVRETIPFARLLYRITP
jgi:hypothetical protein